MKKEKEDVLKEIISEGRWDIDIEKGTVVTHSRCDNHHHIDNCGYVRIGTTIRNKFYYFGVHQVIVCAAGIEQPEGMTVDHINGDKSDNRICNLRVVSGSYNTRLAWENGQCSKENRARNENSGKTHLTNVQVAYIKALRNIGISTLDLAEMFNISYSRISEICRGITWKEIEPKVLRKSRSVIKKRR